MTQYYLHMFGLCCDFHVCNVRSYASISYFRPTPTCNINRMATGRRDDLHGFECCAEKSWTVHSRLEDGAATDVFVMNDGVIEVEARRCGRVGACGSREGGGAVASRGNPLAVMVVSNSDLHKDFQSFQ